MEGHRNLTFPRNPSRPPGGGRIGEDQSPPLMRAFAPVHKMALGVAVGSVFGLAIGAVTLFHVVFRPANGLPLGLLSQYFFGYTVSLNGAVVGLFWGFFTGFIAGWFVAFVRNLTTAIKVFTLRTKGELANTRDFLDHI